MSIWLTRVQDFRAFVEATRHDAKKDVFSVEIGGRFGFFPRGDHWEKPGFAQTEEHPVCGVSWNDAKAFCKWLTEKERKDGKLLRRISNTACPPMRNGSTHSRSSDPGKTARYPWGTTWPPPEGRGNFAGHGAARRRRHSQGLAKTGHPRRHPAEPQGSIASPPTPSAFTTPSAISGSFARIPRTLQRNRRILRGGSWGTSEP